MSDVVIKVESVSKQYRLGSVGTGTLSHDLNRFWASIRGKDDPYLRIGDSNDRTLKGNSEYVWALQDISFEVKQGEILGIIGRNGAGKSTLLKILSQITRPTKGSVKMKGRVGSLLEVGTGFHPDLTGRENLYINGAILGMRRGEINRKLDEIIDFAGVERYIDTPVKRYSSGMLVRLGFAVAAHLEPEILIVDEVLAVGDMSFQKKCLGKMEDVSKQGRTVLFVSHNLGTLSSLCQKGLLIQKGKLILEDKIKNVIDNYFSEFTPEGEHIFPIESSKFVLNEIVSISNKKFPAKSSLEMGETLKLKFKFRTFGEIKAFTIACLVSGQHGDIVFSFNTDKNIRESLAAGTYEEELTIPFDQLKPGRYILRFSFGEFLGELVKPIYYEVNVVNRTLDLSTKGYREDRPGLLISNNFEWKLKKLL